MNSGHPGKTVEERRMHAKRLVSELEGEELFVLAGLAMGMSRRAIADRRNSLPDDVERTVRSLMYKLGAPTIVDVVRLAILADLTLFH